MFYNHAEIKNQLLQLENEVIENKISPFKAARILLEKFKK